jgi:3-oxoacyl-[acyl-carrier protein] reductase
VMTAQHAGRLIFIASGLPRQPMFGTVASGTAKGALITLVRYLALELGPDGITANAVAPGLVQTEINQDMPEQVRQQVAARTPLRRVGQPDDVAGVVSFLAGDEGQFVTGACIHVSGGLVMD